MPGKQVRSPSYGLLTGSRTEASARRREVRVKREAERGASQARGGAKYESSASHVQGLGRIDIPANRPSSSALQDAWFRLPQESFS